MNPLVWGATPAEHARAYPADALVPAPLLMTRAVPVDAPTELTWRWLCQVAVAPYSYDWIDNRGRRSPQSLTPGADRLEVGQVMAVVFRLTSYDDGHQWTAVTGAPVLGRCAITYAAEAAGSESRIVCRLAASAGGVLPTARAYAIACGDLIMMRRQLLNLKALAERDARNPVVPPDVPA